jgi:hypothetical protein
MGFHPPADRLPAGIVLGWEYGVHIDQRRLTRVSVTGRGI